MRNDRELFMNSRIIFTINFCDRCAIWLEFVERFNLNMPPEKRINIINCSKWQETGISDNPLINKYSKYIDGFPTMFFEGKKISGTNSREEAEAFLKVLCLKDFKLQVSVPYLFDKKCSYKQTIFGRRILCQ